MTTTEKREEEEEEEEEEKDAHEKIREKQTINMKEIRLKEWK